MPDEMADKAEVRLTGVPETLLWNLYNRAVAARRPGALLDDPRAVELVDSIDYDFGRFGAPTLARWHELRVLCFDREVRRFMAARPGGTVVALGEGLETQFWRVDDGRVRWLTVDLPETVEVRRRLLGDDPPRRRTLAVSALDFGWMDAVETSQGVLITAQGLLMYLQPAEVRSLVAACAERFPGGTFVFDAVPDRLAERSRRGELRTDDGYQVPPWTWSLTPGRHRFLKEIHPNIAAVRDLRLPRGRGALALAPWAALVPVIRKLRMPILEIRFGPGT